MARLYVRVCALLCGSVVTLSAQNGAKGTSTPAQKAAAVAAGPLDRRVTLSMRGVPLLAAVREIDQQAALHLNYSEQVLPADSRVTIVVDSVPARTALARVLKGTGVVLRETAAGDLMLVNEARETKGDRRAEGMVDTTTYAAVVVRVMDTVLAKPLQGAVVGVKDTKIVATTTDQGYALLRRVPSGLHEITVRFLGYAPEEREVVVADSGFQRVNFALRMGMTRLQDVVTTASGPARRYELGNDVTILNVDSIVATQPISSVTDLLEGRVPGLTVQHTSGAPGDPSRIRLRGTSSMLRSNDPILIVDGIRVYAAQSDAQSGNIATGRRPDGTADSTHQIAAPSPLDQLDPNSIATIEVMKGPSAATLYGPDAANGVIVITSKRGRPGPARWTASATRGLTYIPGQFPVGLYRWGHDLSGNARLCILTDFTCHADSLVHFQALNEPHYSPLQHGSNTSASLGVSGGTEGLTYAVTGSYADEAGLLELPSVEIARFQTQHGGAAPSDWMQRPEQLKRWSGTSRLTAKINDRMDASLSTTLTRESQQRSTLEQQLQTFMSTYIDPTTGAYWRANGVNFSPVNELAPDFYQRVTDDATNFTNAATISWRPRSWLTTSADAGLNTIGRQDDVLLPRGMLTITPDDSLGRLSTGHASTAVSTLNLHATATTPLPWGFHLQLATGANYTKTSLSSLVTGVSDLAPGTTSLNGAGKIDNSSQSVSDVTSFGWYLEPTFMHDRFTISTGLRLDGSSSFGSNVKLPAFPKLGVSWLVSEEPFFPFKNFFSAFRLRAAYGRAGVWPEPTDQLRLYHTSRPWLGGGFQDAIQISTIGNSQLRPERSSEMEGGFDADFLHDRFSIGATGYRKMRYDALESVPVAPSVYGYNVNMLRNIGVVRNTGLELSVATQIVRTDPVTWSASFNLSRNHNVVTELGAGILPFGTNDARVVAGYPLFGRWAKPILGYADANQNGVIERSEVLLGDTLVYMGASQPNYEANLFTTLSLLRGAVMLSAGFAYQDGLTQQNSTIGGPGLATFSPGVSDPSSSFGEQAAVAVMNQTSYGLLQTVSTLRLNSVAITFNASSSLAQRFGAKALSLALQGTNVGLWTNYAGKDPSVNAYATGNSVADTGVLPLPRLWLVTVRATY